MRDVSGAHGRWVRRARWRCINTHRSGNARIGKRAADRVRRRHGWPPVASLCRFSSLLLYRPVACSLFPRDYHLPFFRFYREPTVHHRGQQPSVAKTWRNELVVSSTLQVHDYGVSLKWATGESDRRKWNVKKNVARRRWILRLVNKIRKLRSFDFDFFNFVFDVASSENCNKIIL